MIGPNFSFQTPTQAAPDQGVLFASDPIELTTGSEVGDNLILGGLIIVAPVIGYRVLAGQIAKLGLTRFVLHTAGKSAVGLGATGVLTKTSGHGDAEGKNTNPFTGDDFAKIVQPYFPERTPGRAITERDVPFMTPQLLTKLLKQLTAAKNLSNDSKALLAAINDAIFQDRPPGIVFGSGGVGKGISDQAIIDQVYTAGDGSLVGAIKPWAGDP